MSPGVSFPTGFSAPAPTPLFDLRRLILSIVAFVRMLLPVNTLLYILLTPSAFSMGPPGHLI